MCWLMIYTCMSYVNMISSKLYGCSNSNHSLYYTCVYHTHTTHPPHAHHSSHTNTHTQETTHSCQVPPAPLDEGSVGKPQQLHIIPRFSCLLHLLSGALTHKLCLLLVWPCSISYHFRIPNARTRGCQNSQSTSND